MEESLAEQKPPQQTRDIVIVEEHLVEQKPPQPVPTNPITLSISNNKTDGKPESPSHYNAELPTDGKPYGFAVASGGSPPLFPNSARVVATSITFHNEKYVLFLAGNGFSGPKGGIPASQPFQLQTKGDPVDISKWTAMAKLK